MTISACIFGVKRVEATIITNPKSEQQQPNEQKEAADGYFYYINESVHHALARFVFTQYLGAACLHRRICARARVLPKPNYKLVAMQNERDLKEMFV